MVWEFYESNKGWIVPTLWIGGTILGLLAFKKYNELKEKKIQQQKEAVCPKPPQQYYQSSELFNFSSKLDSTMHDQLRKAELKINTIKSDGKKAEDKKKEAEVWMDTQQKDFNLTAHRLSVEFETWVRHRNNLKQMIKNQEEMEKHLGITGEKKNG